MKRLLVPVLVLIAARGLIAQTGSIEVRRHGRVVSANHREAPNAIRVLLIGNSLTYWNEMPTLARSVAESLKPPRPLVTQFSGGSGMTLRQHWERGKALAALQESRWDYVVLQPQSGEAATGSAETAKYARLFDEKIRKAGAKAVLLVTWPPPESGTPQAQLTSWYTKLANDLGAELAPVGPAMAVLRAHGIETLDSGRLHPNLRGSYLEACVLYSVVYGKPPTGATHVFDMHFDIPESYRRDLENERLDDRTAQAIEIAAWLTVRPPS